MNLHQVKADLQLTLRITKGISYCFGLFTQLAYIAFLAYCCVVSHNSARVANIILISLSVAYLLFFLVWTKFGRDVNAMRRGVVAKRFFQYSRRLIRIYNFGLMVYGFFLVRGDDVGIMAFLLCSLLFTLFVIKFFFDANVYIISKVLKKVIFKIKVKMNDANFHPILFAKEFYFRMYYKIAPIVPAIAISDEEAEAIRIYQDSLNATNSVLPEEGELPVVDAILSKIPKPFAINSDGEIIIKEEKPKTTKKRTYTKKAKVKTPANEEIPSAEQQ